MKVNNFEQHTVLGAGLEGASIDFAVILIYVFKQKFRPK